MKKLTTILLLAFTFSLQAQLAEDYSFDNSAKLHSISGVVISGTTFIIVYKKTGDEALAKRAGIIFGVGAGMLKEMADFAMGGEIMLSDVLYTSVFSIATSLTMQGIVKHRKKKQKKLLDDTWSLDNEFINTSINLTVKIEL
jgi:hypothetical protein